MERPFNILLVDDDEIDREAIRRGLTAAGASEPIRTASDGLQALQMLTGNGSYEPMPSPCIILTDLNMPRMDGQELLHAIKNDPVLAENVVFVLSTTTDPTEIQTCYDLGATGFMNKSTIAQDFSLLVDFLRVYERLVTFPA